MGTGTGTGAGTGPEGGWVVTGARLPPKARVAASRMAPGEGEVGREWHCGHSWTVLSHSHTTIRRLNIAMPWNAVGRIPAPIKSLSPYQGLLERLGGGLGAEVGAAVARLLASA
jgi:hypothetical protein